MGNKTAKASTYTTKRVDDHDNKQKQNHHGQYDSSWSNSLRSFVSFNSHQSSYTSSRSWPRTSRKRAPSRSYKSSDTAWPIAQRESYFLPEFPVNIFHYNNKFSTLEEINKGSFGKVYKVKDLELEQIFALKVLSKSKVLKENSLQQVKEEVQIQKACGHHPFIVDCPAQWQSKNHLFIVLEFVEGGELWNLLDLYGVLPSVLIQLYVAQIALAIDFLHNAGVIYRDLKPENILLDTDANIKLIDFGLSKWLPYGQKTKTLCGTARYMAPEIFGSESYGHPVDWWSLGVIACLMFTKKFPYHMTCDEGQSSDDSSSITQSIVLPTCEDFDLASKDLLLRLLELDPTKRLKSVRALSTIAFYKGFDFEAVKDKKVRPRDLLEKHCKPVETTKPSCNDFEGFDETF